MPTHPTLRREHHGFLPAVDAIGLLAERVGELPPEKLCAGIDELHDFLAHVLLPHAVGEGRTVYPQVRGALGEDDITARMNRDHAEIAELTDELEVLRKGCSGEKLSRQQELAVSRVLRDLHALIRDHFEREEEICCGAMEGKLSDQEAEEVLTEMRRTASELAELYE